MTDPLRGAARRHAGGVALDGPRGPVTFGQLDERVQERADAWTAAAGVWTALEGSGGLDFVVALLALWRTGSTVVLLGDRLPAAAVAGLKAHYGLVDPGDAAPPHRTPHETPHGHRPGSSPSGARIAVLTSGTTGPPRPAVHTPESLLASARGAAAHLGFAAGDRWLATLPMHHVGGLGVLIRALATGATVVLPDGEPGEVLAHARITHVSLVATQLRRLVESGVRPPPALRCVLLGGGPVPEGLTHAARDWPLVMSYGLTEMGSLVTATDPGGLPEDRATSGRVLPGREILIGDDGRILVRGDALFAGYLAPDGRIERELDADGWFDTGDLGTMDREGRLVVAGRADNRFVSGGENIRPEAIEEALLAAPGVTEAVVVPVPDPEFGERPFAFVRGPEAPLDAPALAAHVARLLPRFMVPVGFAPMPDPPPGTIKPSRVALRETARRRRGA